MNKVKFFIAATLILFPFVFCMGAGKPVQADPAAQKWTVVKKDNTMTRKLGDAYVTLMFQGNSIYSVAWGDKSFRNVSKGQFATHGNGNPEVVAYDSRAIILEQGCGSDCRYFVVLPMKADTEEKKYAPAFIYDLAQSLVAYDISQTDPGVAFRIENFDTGAYMDLSRDGLLSGDEGRIEAFHFEQDKFVVDLIVKDKETGEEVPKTVVILLK